MADVELPETEALLAWQAIERRVLEPERTGGLLGPVPLAPVHEDPWTSRRPRSRT